MDQVLTPQRKSLAVRGIQMLVIGVMSNIGLTIIGFLAFVQFLWMLITQERNSFISDVGVSIRDWYSTAIDFLLGNSEDKPFPWSKP
jgi:hypothetical protein